MSIPAPLQKAIEKLTHHVSFSEIGHAREELSRRYRDPSQKKKEYMTSQDHRLAYLVARMPATYAVFKKVLKEIFIRKPEMKIQSLLDLGTGPGTGMWAACDVVPELEHIHLVEQDAELMRLGKQLSLDLEHTAAQKAKWELHNLETLQIDQPYDLITLSYVVGELPMPAVKNLLDKCWAITKGILVVIEPGTPAGFERMRTIRQHLMSQGAFLVAPCPHAFECPMSGNDWCHFSERIERSFLHRYVKQGTLSYEDEKYSYLAVSKIAAKLPQSRILRHPIKRSGHVRLTLCTPDGMQEKIMSKKNSQDYKGIRKLEWGEAIP